MRKSDILKAVRSENNCRVSLVNASVCGCYYCCRTFAPTEIKEWTDEGDEEYDKAICPYCDIDAVIGEGCGIEINEKTLGIIKKQLF